MRTDERNKSRDELIQSMPCKEEDQRSTKITSMKRAFILFWHGVTGILAGIADWFTVILGMKDNSKYGKIIRRIVGTSFAIVMVVLAIVAVSVVGRAVYELVPRDIRQSNDDEYAQYLSRNAAFWRCSNKLSGYVATADGEKTITDVHWVVKPLGNDSLVCYSNGKKRGYFNMFTGKPVVEPKYDHAWIFSDGLASVDDGGWIKFIDSSGKVAIDPKIPYMEGTDGFVFHNGHCVVHNDRRDRFGLIDKHGNWVLKPEYFQIIPRDTFWILDKGDKQSVVDKQLRTVIPFVKDKLWVYRGCIIAAGSNHVLRKYNLQGELVNDFLVSDVLPITYDTDELHYSVDKGYDDDGTLQSEQERAEPVQQIAKCKMYEAESGWYGLMAADGKIITPPSYTHIKAISYDTYLCMYDNDNGVVLNGKGECVR